MYKIVITEYNPNWPVIFEKEAKFIQKALGANCLTIYHIGSTAVPGLIAKPIVDILPIVRNILDVDQVTHAMEDLGYMAKGEYGIAYRRYFQKGKEVRSHNVHIFEEGNPEIIRYLKFRDWLRSHDEDAAAYAKLKLDLAAKYSEDIDQYTLGKDDFVARILAKE